uniref:Uncharacterized protein n=1 Tax=Arundo donax TaxID=35708 RepID=A0A0A8YUX1_ARUDO
MYQSQTEDITYSQVCNKPCSYQKVNLTVYYFLVTLIWSEFC